MQHESLRVDAALEGESKSGTVNTGTDERVETSYLHFNEEKVKMAYLVAVETTTTPVWD